MTDPINPFLKYVTPETASPVAAPPSASNPFSKYVAVSGAETEGANAPPPALSETSDKYTLSEVPHAAAANFLPSVKEHVANVAKSFTDDPIEFVLNLLPSHKHKIDMINHLNQQYGSWDAAKTTAAEDPASFLTTAMIPLAAALPVGGSSAANMLRKFIDPAEAAMLARKGATQGAGFAARQGTEAFEGIAGEALNEMFRNGEKITPGTWKTYTKGLDFEKSYDAIKNVLDKKLEARSAGYLEDMAKVEGADKPVDFSKVDAAVGEAGKIKMYKAAGDKSAGPGYQYETDPGVKSARGQILAEIEKFRAMGPEYHTAIGFDKLKQAINDLGEGLRVGTMPTSGSAFAGKISSAVRKTILDEVPSYGQAMENYATKTDSIKQLIKEFNLGNDNNKLTTLRKLQKVYRQTADVAHGETTNLLREAVNETGQQNLMSHLAAGQFTPWKPRGMRGTFLPYEAMTNPGKLAELSPIWSPRLAGGVAYGAGRVSGSPVGRALRGAESMSPWLIRDLNLRGPQSPPEENHGGYFGGLR